MPIAFYSEYDWMWRGLSSQQEESSARLDPKSVTTGSQKRYIWIPKALHRIPKALHVMLPGSNVTLPRSKCNASRIQMKRFKDPGGTAKTDFERYIRTYCELENNSFSINLTIFGPRSYKKIVQRARVPLKLIIHMYIVKEILMLHNSIRTQCT